MLGIVSSRYNLIRIEVIFSILPLISGIVYCLIKNKKYLLYVSLVGSFFILGYASTNYFSVDKLSAMYEEDVDFAGIVTGIYVPKGGSDYDSFSADCKINKDGREIEAKVILYLKNGRDIRPGMEITGSGTILEPSKAGNFLEFDYKDYLMNRGVDGTLISGDFVTYDGIGPGYRLKNGFRDYIIETINDNLDAPEGGLLKGILLGDTDFINEDLLESIRGVGAAHVLAVSGLHIGIIIASIGFILRLFRMNRRHALVLSLFIGWIYAWFIGFPLSVLRALIMMTFVILGSILHRKYDMLNSIMNAICLMLIARPLWLFDTGFQMSFAAVMGICLFNRTAEYYEMSKIFKYLLFIIFVQIFVFPVSLYYFNQISLLGIIANLLIVPVVSATLFLTVWVLPLNLISGFVSAFLFIFIEFALKTVVFATEILTSVEYTLLNFRSPEFDEIIVYYMLVAAVLYFLSYPEERYRFKAVYRITAITVILHISVFHMIPLMTGNSLRISIINVGQGSASLLQYENKNYMIDAGGTVNGAYEVADRVLPDYLVKRGVGVLDAIFITHYHADHYSGIDKIDEKVKIKSIISGHRDDMIISEFNKDIDFLEINRGDSIKLGKDLAIDVIWPPVGFESDNENNNSLVLLVDFKGTEILFTGDMEKEVEDEIADSLDKTDILIVPHHGSETSSSENFLLKTMPVYGIMSYGKNSYGIPSKDVIKRYEDINTNLYETYIDGEVVINVEGRGGYTVKSLNEDVEAGVAQLMTGSILLVAAAYLTGNIRIERKCRNEQQGRNNIDRQ
nr:DNA internalization-related competence protein ComEC/Rec2 [Dethiosulfatibacter aminovorans]